MSDLINTAKEDKAREKKERRRRRELSDIRTVIKSPEGRRLYWRVMSEAGVFKQSFTGEVNTTLFNEGRRSLGNWLFSELFDANPNAFTQLSQENDSELESERRIEELERKQDGILA